MYDNYEIEFRNQSEEVTFMWPDGGSGERLLILAEERSNYAHLSQATSVQLEPEQVAELIQFLTTPYPATQGD